MSLENIKSIWTAFAKDNNIELINKQRTINNVIQTQFAINYNTPTAFFSWIAFNQQSDKKSTGITSIIIELKDKLDRANFKLDSTTEKKTEFDSKIINLLQQFKGQSISLNNHFIKIDCQHIFNNLQEFNAVINLLHELKIS